MATSTGPTPPSPRSSHPASTDQYSLPSSVCGRSIAESEDKDTPMNSAEDITPGQQCATTSSRRVIVPSSDIELSDFDDLDWTDVVRKKRKKNSPNSSPSAETVRSTAVVPEGLTVIFTPVEQDQVITSLSSLRLSNTLAKTFPECILEIRYNSRLNLVAVDVRNGQTTRGLLRCTELCGIKVRAYEPLPRQCATGVIKDVDTTLTDEEITNNLRSPENRVARLRRLGKSSAIRISFCGSSLPSFVYLGLVRHPVTPFQEKPVQCRKCCRYGHREASCKHSPVCKRCGNTHEDRDSCTAQERCVNCGAAHSATSTSFDYYSAKAAVQASDWPELPRKSEESSSTMQDTLTSKTENQRPKGPTYATLIKLPRKDEPKAPLTKEGPSSNRVNLLEDPKTTGSAPTDPRQRRTTRRRTLSVSTDTAPSKGWVLNLQAAANFACRFLESVDAEWARSILTLLQLALPLIRSL
ncbi:hypothetical protein HPB47_018217 [Ixodes persulcatus]|uniref:Uncharacterized protein n=1 Tax=Ixodes persulcatus TaxID=34615 RepID=A0AC60QMA5_IXOPE|nr:hypothetical protein HPB47_018217 [Ixodes persulcatus]